MVRNGHCIYCSYVKMDPDVGFREEWYQAPLDLKNDVINMPVPSSYNDITVDPDIRHRKNKIIKFFF